MLWIRWGAAALTPCLAVIFPRLSWSTLALIALALILGNAPLTWLWCRGPDPRRLSTIRQLAPALEWLVVLALVALWQAHPTSKAPALLGVLVLLTGARWGLVGVFGAGVGVILALVALIGWQAFALGLLSARSAARLLVAWLLLLLPHAAVFGCLVWAGSAAWRDELARAQRTQALLLRYAPGLTPRQWEVLLLLARPELSYDDIARRLHLEAETVREYVKRIEAKWGVHGGRAAVVATARSRGLLEDRPAALPAPDDATPPPP